MSKIKQLHAHVRSLLKLIRHQILLGSNQENIFTGIGKPEDSFLLQCESPPDNAISIYTINLNKQSLVKAIKLIGGHHHKT